MRKIFICALIFLSCTTRYVLEERQFGLSERSNLFENWKIIKIDTVWNDQGGVVKIILFKIPVKKEIK